MYDEMRQSFRYRQLSTKMLSGNSFKIFFSCENSYFFIKRNLASDLKKNRMKTWSYVLRVIGYATVLIVNETIKLFRIVFDQTPYFFSRSLSHSNVTASLPFHYHIVLLHWKCRAVRLRYYCPVNISVWYIRVWSFIIIMGSIGLVLEESNQLVSNHAPKMRIRNV